MAIFFHAEDRVFHLQSKSTSYVIALYQSGLVGNLYWGARLSDERLNAHNLSLLRDRRIPHEEAGKSIDYEGAEDIMFAEYPAHGTSDFRSPAFELRYNDGSVITKFRYKSHKIEAGKPQLAGLPSLWCGNKNEAETLTLTLTDSLDTGAETGISVELVYTIFFETGALVRSARLKNDSKKNVTLNRAYSAAIDLAPEKTGAYDVIHLDGSWARERSLVRQSLSGGTISVGSTRGFSSHQVNPFLALTEHDATEESGEVFGFNLVYSGNFFAEASRDQFGSARVLMGINPFNFSKTLLENGVFQTPECVLVFSDEGLGGMSRKFHSLYRNNLIRGEWAHRERPILVNNWEATYFNFTADVITGIAAEAAKLGIELFVLDDGWFGHRDSDNSSLGDWFPDRKKLPDGLNSLAQKVVDLGIRFGLWFEPEMISPDSELYKAHPDWCIHTDGRRRTEIRNQLVLDLTRLEVRDAVVKMVSEILSTCPISYVKWDMNRPLTEISGEKAHDYMLGVYDMMERITGAFPKVLFEGCSGGGARFDPGILYYMSQIWTSDNSDAIDRLKIQYGTSLAYPVSAMGAHVSAVPNHQNGRLTPLETRGNVAMSGNFGYELDVRRFTDAEKATVKQQVEFYKKHRSLIQNGDLYRLKSPFDTGTFTGGNETAWMIVKDDKSQAFVFYARTLSSANSPLYALRLRALEADAVYEVDGEFGGTKKYTAAGSELMNAGIRLPELKGDFSSCAFILTKL